MGMAEVSGTGQAISHDARMAGGPHDDLCHLAEIALRLETWPARNPVMRAALDRARDEVLRLAEAASPEG